MLFSLSIGAPGVGSLWKLEVGPLHAGGMAVGGGDSIRETSIALDSSTPQDSFSHFSHFSQQCTQWEEADTWPVGCTAALRAVKTAVDVCAVDTPELPFGFHYRETATHIFRRAHRFRTIRFTQKGTGGAIALHGSSDGAPDSSSLLDAVCDSGSSLGISPNGSVPHGCFTRTQTQHGSDLVGKSTLNIP